MLPDPLASVLDELKAARDTPRWSATLDDAAHALQQRVDDAEALIDALVEGAFAEGQAEAAEDLLATALDKARMARENGQGAGGVFLEALARRVKALAERGALSSTAAMSLSRSWVRAGLSPPEAVAQSASALSELADDIDPQTLPDPEALFESLARDADNDPSVLHAGLSEMLPTLPPAFRTAIVRDACARPGQTYAALAGYWLLDPSEALRHAAVEGLRRRLEAGAFDAALAGRLVMIRPWLPADTARAALDDLIRAMKRRGASGGELSRPWTLRHVLATLPDGTGAQSIMIAANRGATRKVAMLMLKPGFGVKDAFCVPVRNAAEETQLLEQMAGEVGALEVTPAFVAQAVEIALGDGVEQGLPPAPGLLEVADVCGLDILTPQASDAEALIARADPEGRIKGLSKQAAGRLVNRSDDWAEHHPITDSWFEDDDEVDAALHEARSKRAQETALWSVLETRRDKWARIIARSALTLQAASHPDADSFTATAHALLAGRALRKTPIMRDIVELTLDAWHSRDAEAPAEDEEFGGAMQLPPAKPERKGELARLLKASEITPDWVEGFLMAVVIAPKPVSPAKWVEALLGAAFPGLDEDGLQRYLDILMERHNALNEATADPRAMRERIAALSEEALSQWAQGFTEAQNRFRSAWPGKTLNADDRAMVRAIRAGGGNADEAEALRPLLPAWLERRRELRG